MVEFRWKPDAGKEYNVGVPITRDGVFLGLLIGYICFNSFVHGDSSGGGDSTKPSFDVEDREIGISWVTSNYHLKSGKSTTPQKHLRSEHYRGSLAHFSIPAHCVEFFTWFLRDVRRNWEELFSQSESYLDDRVG